MGDSINTAVLYLYFFQFLYGLFLFFILYRLYRKFQEKYQIIWSFGWLGFSTYFLFSGIALIYILQGNFLAEERTVFSILAISGSFLEVLLFVYAARLIHSKINYDPQYPLIFIIISISLASMLVLPYNGVPGEAETRLFLRVALKSLLVSGGFFYVFYLLYASKTYQSGLGSRAVMLLFLVYGLTQLAYFFTRVITVIYDQNYLNEGGYLIVLIDFIIHAFLGIGMIIWQLENEQQKLKMTSEQLDRFYYSTSHDLRAPIASVMGLLNIMELENSPKSNDQFLEMIKERIFHLDQVISDIINYSRSSSFTPVFEELNPKKFTEKIIDDLKYMENAKGIRYVIKDDVGRMVTDRNILKVILANLLSNAIKYQDTQKGNNFVKIHFYLEGKKNHIEIMDNGKGIRDDQQPHIFEMFYRATSTGTGTGLGLYIVKQYIDNLNGKILVDSTHGEGTTFLVILP